MNILVTGAKGMVGTALCNNLKNIRDGKNKTRPALDIKEIYEYDLDSTSEELDEYCQKADFVFNLAGVNRPENPEDFMKGNFGFASDLLNCLKKHNNKATIMLSSSIQATLAGRFGNSEYGRSKKAGEELLNGLPFRPIRSCEKIGPAEGSSTTIAMAVASMTGDSATNASDDKITSCVRRPIQ